MIDASPVGTAPQVDLVSPIAIDRTSLPFVGQWQRLVSTTNWEKGRIISNWREALQASGAPVMEFSDEAWSRRVGGVSGQHVGRLRRVCERFGQCHENFSGLYWSHFQAALDWEEAEMWLEGAVQNGWSVSEMRNHRWETLHPGEPTAPDQTELTAELDEDFSPASSDDPRAAEANPRFSESSFGPLPEGPDFGESGESRSSFSPSDSDSAAAEPAIAIQPFANLGALPDDLAEAFENFKLALLRHKAEGWKGISCADVLAALDALKQFAVAP